MSGRGNADTVGTDEMIRLRNDAKWTLQQIADKFGISRERVRQRIGNTGNLAEYQKQIEVKQKFEKYKHLSNSKIAKVFGWKQSNYVSRYRNGERHEIDGGDLQIGTEAEKAVSKKLSSLGFKNKLMPHRCIFDILLDNGLKIDVKSSNPMIATKTVSSQYTFNTKKNKKGNYCDFLVLYLRDVKECFVVPMKDTENCVRFCFPEPNMGKKSKWQKYHNRFDLLTHPTPAR